MELFVRIFLLYFTSLSLMPCVPAKDFQSNNQQKAQQSISIDSVSESEGHDKGCSDNCSMFCICTCCGISMVPPPSINILQEKPDLPIKPKPQYAQNYLAHLFISSSWHPPKGVSFLM